MIGFGKVIRQLRKEAGLTQRALARMASATPTYISRLENGAAEPSIALLRRFAKAMQVPPEIIFWEAVEIPDGVSASDRRACNLAKRIVRRWLETSRRSQTKGLKVRSGGIRHK